MNKWWQDPRLGTDDDEGAYDFYAEELPDDNSEWSWYPSKCDECEKERKLHRTDSHYFYCWDGWDSMDYTDCWKCRLESKLHSIKRKIKLKIDVFKFAVELYKDGKKNFNHYYKLAKKIVR